MITAMAIPDALGADAMQAQSAATPMALQLLRNATVKLYLGSRTLLVDPYLAAQNEGFSYAGKLRSPLVPLPLSIDEIVADVDAVFVSHLHSDHFDAAAKQLLPRDLPILCPAALQAKLGGFGFTNVTGIDDELDWFGIQLAITPGRHGPDSVYADMGNVNGLVVRAPGAPTLYWVGDSIWCAEVRQTIDRFQPQHIVVHACGATWEGRGPLVMDEAQVEQLMRHAGGATTIATHMDCVDHATVSRRDLARHFAALPDLASRLHIPADGQVLALAAAGASSNAIVKKEIYMTHFGPYILFEGNCAEAMKFYKFCVGGELALVTVRDSPMAAQMPEALHDRIIHARLRSDAVDLTASDWLLPHRHRKQGNTVCLYLSQGPYEEIERYFTRLSVGADADTLDALKDLPFGSYGALTDKFGVRWMFQGEPAKKS